MMRYSSGRPESVLFSGWPSIIATSSQRSPTSLGLIEIFGSGLPLDPMFSATKARWLLDAHDPDRRRSRAGELRLGTVDSWLLAQMRSV